MDDGGWKPPLDDGGWKPPLLGDTPTLGFDKAREMVPVNHRAPWRQPILFSLAIVVIPLDTITCLPSSIVRLGVRLARKQPPVCHDSPRLALASRHLAMVGLTAPMTNRSQQTATTLRVTIVRCCPAVIVLLLGFIVLCVTQSTDVSITGKPARDIIAIIVATELAAYIAIRWFARISPSRQLAAVGVLCGLQFCLYLSIRIDGFMGDGRPNLAWRWTPTAEERMRAAESRLSTAAALVPATADLATTTPFDAPAFRGNDRNGVFTGLGLSRDWSNPPRLLWKHPMGRGWSSFAVVGDYCVTQEQRGEFEAVVCYELRTGRTAWEHRDQACFDEVTGGKGPRATPTIHDGRVLSLGATGILNCLDGRSGQPIWSTNILADNDAENRIFGMAGSPLVLNGLVVVSPGGRSGSLVAYDLQSGERIWYGGDAAASYSSPHCAAFQAPQILSFNADGLFAHEARSGRVLWSFPWVSNPAERNNVCQPVPLPGHDGQVDRVFISSGYGQGAAMLEIVPRETQFEVRKRWSNRNLKAKFSSVVVRGDHIYGLDERILVCIDATTGDRCWKGGRYGYGQLILVDDLLLVQAESGDVVFVEASPSEHRELGRFAALADRTWNHPVVSGNLLLVRNDREAACYELPLALHD